MSNNNNINEKNKIEDNNLDKKKKEEEEEKKKNKKIFIIVGIAIGIVIIIIILILLLLTFCGKESSKATQKTEAEQTTEVMQVTETEEETGAAEEETSSTAEETSTATEESVEEETTAEETPSETEESAAEEEAVTEAPTIELTIDEGPFYSPADEICYYRIEATVTGIPSPRIEWSKDDSHGAWGPRVAQINLNSPGETYTLTATARNSAGSATDSIVLSWGCNRPPTVHEITLMGDHITGEEYTVSCDATDPDGDTLTYQWSVTGGSIYNPDINPIEWTTPLTPGFYDITVTVDDGKGGTDSLTETVEVIEPNHSPTLGEITITEQKTGSIPTDIYTSQNYYISVEASDPDGDPLNFAWEATGGTITNPNQNPSLWKAPSTQGYYTITVSVNDGLGGTAETFTDVYVSVYLY
jgi:hypothetical protein